MVLYILNFKITNDFVYKILWKIWLPVDTEILKDRLKTILPAHTWTIETAKDSPILISFTHLESQ